MKKWRKILLVGLAAVAASAVCALFAACSGQSGIVNYFVVDESNTIEVSGEKGASVEFPEVSKEGYIFKGWYLDADGFGMPVTGATFEESVTYYAVWAKGYEVVLELEGGTLDLDSKIYLEEGAAIASYMQAYVPTYGDYRFGGWYVGDEPLEANAKMTTDGITLTARYQAAYTVNIWLQNLDDKTQYTKQAAYADGYALIGEEFAPIVSVKGFTQNATEGETELIIDKTVSKNVFELYFDRNEYTLTLSANYPDGSFSSESMNYLYGEAFALPENNFAIEGYRFLGWATSASATYADVITDETYVLESDSVFYAVWNKGYTDMFGGTDYIFLSYEKEGEATLCRGGVDIPGSYNDIKEIYEFKGDGFTISAKLKEDGTFIWYGNRNATYKLVVGNLMYEKVTMYLGDLDECEYTSTVDGDKFSKQGTYTINEDGVYVATLTDVASGEVTTLYFIVGQGTVSSTGITHNIFWVRGDEVNYGEMARYISGSLYYPTVTLDGWGNATVKTTSGSSTGTYTMSENIVTLTIDSETVYLRVSEINGTYIYEYYTASFDRAFTNGDATLTLDGCSSATYVNGSTTVTGTYTTTASYFGGYIVWVNTSESRYVFIVSADTSSGTTEYVFTEKPSDYGEYRYLDGEGYFRASILVISGGTASLYEVKEEEFVATSTGTVEKVGNYYVYTATSEIADWAEYKFASMTYLTDSVADSTYEYHDVFYLISARYDGEDDAVSYATVYTGTINGENDTPLNATLTVTPIFAICEWDGYVVSGIYRDYDDYIRVTIGSGYVYFALTKGETNTFEELSSAPIVYTLTNGTEADSSVTLTLVGATADNGAMTGVYAETVNGEKVKYSGTFTENKIEQFGLTRYVYTFVSDDGSKTFKFTVTINTSTYAYYFYRYDVNEAITIATFNRITDANQADKTQSLVLTDAGLTYTADGVTVSGTVTSETYFAFDQYEAIVYTFTPETGSAFRFTLLSGTSAVYFRISGEDKEYTSADGSKIEIDGLTNIARYTDAVGNTYENYYWTTTNMLDADEPALRMVIGSSYYYFDLKSADHTFALRGGEAVSNCFVVKNGTVQNIKLTLNGHGTATVTTGETSSEGTYTIQDAIVSIRLNNGTVYVGELGYIYLLGSYIPTFFIEIEGVEGAYLDESDLSVLNLDAIGNAVRYDSYGKVENGSYTMLDDGLFYYVNSAGTDASVYSYTAGKVVKQTYSDTYYSADFASVVFTKEGKASFNGGSSVWYRYDGEENKIYTYSRTAIEDQSPNAYGFYITEYDISGDQIIYNGTTYSWFDGYAITLTDAAGNTLIFAPDGEASFQVDAMYTEKESDTITTYTLVVSNDEGTVTCYLAEYKTETFHGGAQKFNFLYNYTALTLDWDKGSFTFDSSEYVCAYTSYDYKYLMSGSESDFALIRIFGEAKDGTVEYTLSGGFNYITDEKGAAVTFSDGVISKAGYLNQNYGNLFISEFVGSDGNTYHLTFYMAITSSGYPCFITYALTRVTSSIDLGDGTVVYQEELVNTLFNFEQQAGEKFYPTLKYKGQLICSHNWGLDEEQNQWLFVALEYGNSSYDYYYFDFDVDEEGNVTGGSVVRHATTTYKTSDEGYTVYVEYDVESGEIVEVYGIAPKGGSGESATDCVKNADGTFTVTTDNGTYTVTFGTEDDEEGNQVVTVSVEKAADEGDDSQTENP